MWTLYESSMFEQSLPNAMLMYTLL